MAALLDIATASGIILLVALGLALVLGLMDVINLAHPAFMAVGAYVTYEVYGHGLSLALACTAGVAAAAVAGLAVEVAVMQPLYRRTIDTLLATAGLSLAASQIIVLLFGRAPRQLDGLIEGSIGIAGTDYPAYRLFLLLVAGTIVAILVLVSRQTMLGLRAQAVMENRPLAAGLGINTRRLRTWTFTFGAALAGLAGILIAPLSSVSPQYGANYVVPAFLVAILGGRSLPGLCLAAIIIGGGQSLFARLLDPIYSIVVMVLVAVLLLRLLPSRWLATGATA